MAHSDYNDKMYDAARSKLKAVENVENADKKVAKNRSSTPILDEINRKIDRDKAQHYSRGEWNKDFEPVDTVLTPERYIALMQEIKDRYPFVMGIEERRWRGSLIRVVRTA